MKAFDLRRVQSGPRTEASYDNKDVEDVENKANNAAITMIYKLNDSLFRPIFVSFLSWAANLDSLSSKDRIQRQITYYKFLACFFDRLKVQSSPV